MDTYAQFTLEKVEAIPSSRWNKHRNGQSKYDGILNQIKELPVNEPMLIQHPSFNSKQVYNALWLMLKKKKIKNIRIAMRKEKVYAQKMFN